MYPARKLVALSAGHYPASPGASYADPITREILATEHELACEWATCIQEGLAAIGMTGQNVLMVPALPLAHKIDVVNRAPVPLCAVEVHFNAAVDRHGKNVGAGCETLYAPDSVLGKDLAACVHDGLATIMPTDRGIKEGWYRMDAPRRVDYPGDVDGDEHVDAFLLQTKCPAIIIEPEFIHLVNVIRATKIAACEKIAARLAMWINKRMEAAT